MNQPRRRSKDELWFPFPLQLVHSGIWATLSKSAQALYPGLCAFGNFNDGTCYPSLNRLQKVTGLARSSVVRSIKELEKKGLIVRRPGGRKSTNHYTIVGWAGRR